MEGRNDMAGQRSSVTRPFLETFVARYGIPRGLNPTAPPASASVRDAPAGMVALYTAFFSYSNFRVPVSRFLCEVLRYYTVHLTQIVPLGLIKVYQFEISCRALSFEPEVNLFRCFYKLSRIGEWVTFEKRKSPMPSHISRTLSSLKHWKDHFFFVSSRIIPFQMHWLDSEKKLVDPFPRKGEYDESAYELLWSEPTSPRPFSEHFLVAVGISRIWAQPRLRPVMLFRGERMGLFDRMKLSAGAEVVETTEVIPEGEPSVLDATVGFTVDPGEPSSGVIGKRKGSVAKVGGVLSSPPCKKLVSRGVGLGAPGLKPNTSPKAPAAAGRVMASTESESSSDDRSSSSNSKVASSSLGKSLADQGDDTISNPLGTFVPDWPLTNGTILETPNLCREFLQAVRTPAEAARDASLSHRELSREGCTAAVNALFTFIETHQRYAEGVFAKRELKRKVSELTEKCASLESDKLAFQNALNGKDSEIAALRSELQTIKCAEEARVAGLEDVIASLRHDRRWLISSGMRQAFEKVRNSDEFLDMLAGINSLADSVGFNAGLREGIRLGKVGKSPSDDPKYDPSAFSRLKDLSDEFDRATFPVSDTIASMQEADLSAIQSFLAPDP
ncbi:hypothetical protein E3N88_44356 [Mikania micrantha]|uniref:Transposase (putative) gypsy type domain-containing protein n=1 Tax=Mikania micrantha TaxID=192012 RepID=A0A5N6LC89_9ASTR|nr:hypothetical protein E3N88_44356 [Mikania micrantha]